MAHAATTTRIELNLTPAGIGDARSELDRLEALLGGSGSNTPVRPSPPPSPLSPDEAPQRVFHSATEDSRTRELLKALPGDASQALTPTEIGELLTPNDDGTALNSAQVRAVMRNEKKIEGTLKKRGVIPDDREVVIPDFSRYEDEGCGRYHVSPEDHAVLKTL